MRECEENSRFVQFKGVSQLDLATSKSPEWHTFEACREAEWSLQLEHYRTKLLVWPGS